MSSCLVSIKGASHPAVFIRFIRLSYSLLASSDRALSHLVAAVGYSLTEVSNEDHQFPLLHDYQIGD